MKKPSGTATTKAAPHKIAKPTKTTAIGLKTGDIVIPLSMTI